MAAVLSYYGPFSKKKSEAKPSPQFVFFCRFRAEDNSRYRKHNADLEHNIALVVQIALSTSTFKDSEPDRWGFNAKYGRCTRRTHIGRFHWLEIFFSEKLGFQACFGRFSSGEGRFHTTVPETSFPVVPRGG